MEFEAGKIKQPRSAPKRREPEYRLTNKSTGKKHTYASLSALAWGVVSQKRDNESAELVIEKVYTRYPKPVWGPMPETALIELKREVAEVADETPCFAS